MNMDFKVIKYKHLEGKWFALYEMAEDMYAIVIYGDDEEDILFSCIELDYTTALHKFNKIKDDTNFIIGDNKNERESYF